MKSIGRKLKDIAAWDIAWLLRGSAFIFGMRATGAVVTYVTQVLLARWMGAAELGVYVFALSGCAVLFQASTLGLPAAAIRFVPQYEAAGEYGLAKGFVRRTQRIVLASSVLFAALAISALYVLDWRVPNSETLARVLAFFSIPFFALIITNSNVARSISLIALAVLPNNLLRQLLLLLGIVGAYMILDRLSATIVMALLLSVVVCLAIGQWALLRQRLRGRFGQCAPRYETRLWLRTALPLLAVAGFTQSSLELNLLVAGLHLPSDELAIFNAAYRTSNFVNYGTLAIGLMAAPRVSRLFFEKDSANLQRLITQQAQLRSLFAVCAAVALVIFGNEILSLFGEQFVIGFRALAILMAAHVLVGAAGPAIQILAIAGHQGRCALVFASAAVGTVIANTILVPIWGIEGAALAVLAVSVSWASWLYVLARRHTGVEPSIFGFGRTGQ